MLVPLPPIAAGGALGGLARYAVAAAWPVGPGAFPWSTLTVNITGSFLLGMLMVLVLEVWRPTRYVRLVLGVGLLGAYTTFSTLAVEADLLTGSGHVGTAAGYLLVSAAGGLAALWAGRAAVRGLASAAVRRRPGEAHEKGSEE